MAIVHTEERFFFSLPFLALTLVSPLDGMARNYHFHLFFIYEDAQDYVILTCLDPIYLSYHLIPERKKHLDNAGIEPSSPAWQASTLSITPSPLGRVVLDDAI